MASRAGKSTGLLLAVLFAAGCVNHAPLATQPSEAAALPFTPLSTPSLIYSELSPGELPKPDDQLIAHLELVDITAPAGAISTDPRFWQIVGDRTLDPQWQGFLSGNGIRAGLVERPAWGELKGVFDRYSVSSQQTNIRGTGRGEIACNSVAELSLFFFDRLGRLHGRTYDDAQCVWGITFAPNPAKPGYVTVEMCPVVRSMRRQMQFNRLGGEYELKYVQPESLYDLGLKLDVPLGMILVLAPTAKPSNSSIGYNFLLKQEPSRVAERVLLLWPRMYRFNQKATELQVDQAIKNLDQKAKAQ